MSGKAVVSGTTGGDVIDVRASIGGGPFVYAVGTAEWEVKLDTRSLTNGSTTLVAIAREVDGREVSTVIPVKISNVDPLVGEWRLTKTSVSGNYCKGQIDSQYQVYFFASGEFVDGGYGLIQGCFSGLWEREGEDLILIRNDDHDRPVRVDMLDKDHFRVDSYSCGLITFTRVAGPDFASP